MTPQKLLINHLDPSSLLRRGWVLTLLAVGSFALSPQTQAVNQPNTPDPGPKPVSNTADGLNALLSITSGVHNAAFGFDALLLTSDTSFNTAVGSASLLLNIGESNTAVGAGALLSNNTAGANNAVGAFALFNNDSDATGAANFNNAHGREALFNNVDGSENNAFGDLAMFNNTTGNTNTAVGDDALFNCTTGNSNTALGDEAGTNLVDGEGNIYIGAQVNQGDSGELEFIRIGNDTAFAFPYDTFIAGIFNRAVASGTAQFVFVDDTGKLGTVLVDAIGNKVATPQAMLDESRNQQKRIAELEATVERQQKGMEVLTAQLKEQAAQIQRVSAQLEVRKPATKVALRNQ